MKISLIILGILSLIEISICGTDVVHLSLLSHHREEQAYGDYFYGISAFENDEMSVDIKILEPVFYYENIDFYLAIKGFSGYTGDYPDDSTIKYNVGYTQIPFGEYVSDSTCTKCICRYPFSTIENVSYLGFYLQTYSNYDIEIYIRSDKAETAVGLIVLIIVIVILVLAAIGAGVTFLLRKIGCWVRIHSSSI